MLSLEPAHLVTLHDGEAGRGEVLLLKPVHLVALHGGETLCESRPPAFEDVLARSRGMWWPRGLALCERLGRRSLEVAASVLAVLARARRHDENVYVS